MMQVPSCDRCGEKNATNAYRNSFLCGSCFDEVHVEKKFKLSNRPEKSDKLRKFKRHYD